MQAAILITLLMMQLRSGTQRWLKSVKYEATIVSVIRGALCIIDTKSYEKRRSMLAPFKIHRVIICTIAQSLQCQASNQDFTEHDVKDHVGTTASKNDGQKQKGEGEGYTDQPIPLLTTPPPPVPHHFCLTDDVLGQNILVFFRTSIRDGNQTNEQSFSLLCYIS